MSDTFDNLPPLEPASSELTDLINFARSDLPTEEQWAALSAHVADVWGSEVPTSADSSAQSAATESPAAESPAGELPAGQLQPQQVSSGAEVAGGVKVAAPLTTTAPLGVKVVGVAALAGALASGVWFGTERSSVPRAQAVASAPSAESARVPELELQPGTAFEPSAEPAVAPRLEVASPPSDATREPDVRAADEAARAPQPPVATKPSELGLLTRARDQLNRNPEQSLALCRQHQRLYPRGQLAQEREVLMIEALTRLKREREANQRRTQFGKTFPDSPHQSRVKQGSED